MSVQESSPIAFNEGHRRIDVASAIVSQRYDQIQAVHGSLRRSGPDPSEWLPFHSNELRVLPLQIPRIFSAALDLKSDPPKSLASGLADLHARDLPALIVATGLIYPDFTDLYKVDCSLILAEMNVRPDTFTQRDKNLVQAAVSTVITVPEKSAPRTFVPVDQESPYALQSTIFADTLLSYSSQRSAMPFGMLVCLERLIKAENPILTHTGERPRTLAEVLDPRTTYDKDVLRSRLREMDDYFYADELTDDLQLPSSREFYPHYIANKVFC